MPRRIPDFPDAYSKFNAISSYGSIISVVASVLFFLLITVVLSKVYVKRGVDNK
jgi:cytochrome c oxidase subunit 1